MAEFQYISDYISHDSNVWQRALPAASFEEASCSMLLAAYGEGRKLRPLWCQFDPPPAEPLMRLQPLSTP